jgi:hypothetical protein
MTRWALLLVAVSAAALLPAGCASPLAATGGDDLGAGPGGDDLAGIDPHGTDLAGADFALPAGDCHAGTACATGNPGDCASGHVVCSGGVATCMPDVTTQSCFDGPAAKRDVGVCKSGTQSCIGTLGECKGELLPAAQENCFNDLDDDCDGKADNRCPDGLSVGAQRPLSAHGGNGGSPLTALCPAGTWLLKTTMYLDDTDKFIAGLDVWCAAPRLVRGTTSYTVGSATLPTTPSASAKGAHAGSGVDFTCAGGGDVGQWSGVRSGSYVSAFGMFCGSATLTLATDNTLGLSFAPVGTNAPQGYDHADPLVADNCAANEALVGYNVRAGDYMDQVQSVCAPLTVTYK